MQYSNNTIVGVKYNKAVSGTIRLHDEAEFSGKNLVMMNNEATRNSAFLVDDAELELTDSVISNNTAEQAATILTENHGNVTLEGCQFNFNYAYDSSGIMAVNSEVILYYLQLPFRMDSLKYLIQISRGTSPTPTRSISCFRMR